ncbi:MAG: flavodoxin family protein [Spirochaetia bacterium]|nr:flavodoxin family protein [Spirochaetia bacterium]MCF7952570.1 flavodoxin family protein [Spirochaetales bacterium]
MNIIGIVGSRRKKGNTAVMVKEALKAAESQGAETELIFLDDFTIEECRGCDSCLHTYRCVIKDDMQKLYPRLLSSDGLILGSPAYFYGMSGLMKMMMDRCYCFEAFAEDDRSVWLGIGEVLGPKYAVVLAVSGQTAIEDMGCTQEGMEKGLASLGWRVVDSAAARGYFEAGDAAADKALIKRVSLAGYRLAETIALKERTERELAVFQN